METCYKAFRTDLIKRIPLRSDRFGFEPEVTMKVAKLGCRIFEVPISYHGRDYAEGKKIGPRDAVSAVWTLLKYWVVSDIGHVGQHTLARMSELGRLQPDDVRAVRAAFLAGACSRLAPAPATCRGSCSTRMPSS